MACTTTNSSAEGSCAVQFTYGGRTYTDVANADFQVGEKIGTATAPYCDDTGASEAGQKPPVSENAYRVEGVAPEKALAVGPTPEDAVLVAVRSGKELPPEVQQLTEKP
ncbi:DUF6281 family protein [Streptomyces sp. 12297]